MIEAFQSQNSRDFRQRYSGSYGYYTVPETKKRVLVYMLNIGEERVEFVDEHSTRYNAVADTGVEFEFLPVQKKLFCYKDNLYLIQRHPARMWSRGINPQNTHISTVNIPKMNTVSFPLVKAAVVDVDPRTALQKVKDVEDKRGNCAVVSDLFGIYGSSLYLFDAPVGSFMADRREIKVDEPMFRQEIVDMVERHQLPYKVLANG